MRRRASILPIAFLLALAAAGPAGAHMSANLQDTGSGPQGQGLANCKKVPHELKPYAVLPTDGSLYYRIEPVPKDPKLMKSIESPVKGIKAFAIEEDLPLTLKSNVDEFWSQVEPKLKEKIRNDPGYRALVSQGVDVPDGACELTLSDKRVRWTITEFEVDPSGSVSPGAGHVVDEKEVSGDADGGSLSLGKGFPVPDDPHYYLITARHYYQWEIKTPDGKISFGNKADMVWDSVIMKVLDNTSPAGVYFSPNVLFGTTGDAIAAYNEIRDRHGAPYPANESDIFMIVPDNARYAFEQLVGFRHDPRKVQAKLYAETYISRVTATPPARKQMPIEKAFQEYCEGEQSPPEGMGRFVWVGPIDLREDLGLVPQTVPQEKSGNPEVLNVHVWKIPVAELEKKLLAALIARYGGELEAPPERKLQFLDHHFASGSVFEYREEAWEPLHLPARDIDYTGSKGDAKPQALGKLDFLRITAAVSDAAGNWTLPQEGGLLTWNAANDVATGGAIRLEGAQKTLHHVGFLPLVVLDNDKPNPMILVTAQGRDGEIRTTRYTIPNGDLAVREREESGGTPQIGPYTNIDHEWVFDWKGESPTMQWLAENDPKRHDQYKRDLEILENTRVIFEVEAYDNVNKYVRMEGPNNAYCKYGIWTPQVMPKDVTDLQFERPVTWKIVDPTVPDEDMLYEDKAAKVFVYPDYIYRKVDPARMAPSADGKSGYGVEVLVNDIGSFNDPAKNGGSATNWRKIVLWFNVIPSSDKGIDKMGNQEQVDREKNPAPARPAR